MFIIVKECGEFLKRLEEQRQAAEKRPEKEKRICAAMITEYQDVMLRMEQLFAKQDLRKYLEIRRARYAVEKGFEQIIPIDILYPWMVENICGLEAG